MDKAMARDLDEIIPEIMSVVNDGDAKNTNRCHANLIIELATLTLLIDAKITTTEAAIQQIEKTQNWLSDVYSPDDVGPSIKRAIEFLRNDATNTKPQSLFLSQFPREP
jgi:hypothetical protein